MIVSEFVKHGDLFNFVTIHMMKKINDRGKYLQMVKRLAIGILKGLAVIHSKGLMHRDFNPNNILIGGTKCKPIAKIAGMYSIISNIFGIFRIFVFS